MPAEPMMVDTAVKRVTFLLLNNADHDPNTDPEVRWALDATLKDMVTKTQFAAFKKEFAFATSAGQHTYILPEDFVQLLGYGMRYTASPYTTLTWITEREFLECEYERNVSQADPQYFFVTTKDKSDGLWRFRVHPTPATTIAMSAAYLSMPETIYNTVAGQGQPLDARFPTQFFQFLIYGAAAKFPQYLDPTTLAYYNKEYENAIKLMCNKSEPMTGNVMQKQLYHGSPMRLPGWRAGTVRWW